MRNLYIVFSVLALGIVRGQSVNDSYADRTEQGEYQESPFFYTHADETDNIACTPNKIPLKASMIAGKGNVTALIDEQQIAGDPLGGSGGAPITNWFSGWNSGDYPSTAILNFGAQSVITDIYLRDVNDQGIFKIEVGGPGKWETVSVDSLKRFNVWSQHPVNKKTQYVRLTAGSPTAYVSEIVIYGCLGSLVPDKTPPSPVTTLAAGNVSSTSVQLSWIAPGDDGNVGQVSSYDIRYSPYIISTNLAFDNASKVSEQPIPVPAGSTQSLVVTGLNASTKYYFAVKAGDEADNFSSLSNVVSQSTGEYGESSSVTVDKFIGVNAFIDDPINKIQVAGFIREYHNWGWDEGDIWSGGGNWNYSPYPNNKMRFAPSEAGAGGWNFDNYYRNTKNRNLILSPVIQGAPAWLQGKKDFPNDFKPLDEEGADSRDPNSYEKKANHMYQFAARYGSTYVADSKLQLAKDQPRQSGLGVLKYVEDYNEQDKDWKGPQGQFSAEEYAAMISADYDGHCNTMHQGTGNFGVKNADPRMKLVMGGLSKLDLDYIIAMKKWFEKNRADKKFAADVINVHDYAFFEKGPALSPEEHKFKEKLLRFTNYRDTYLKGKEVWISEFGWDTNPKSVLRVPAVGPFDAQEVQGQWLVRAYLAFAAARVDRAIMFMLRDVNPEDSTQFSTCGLTAKKDDWTPKKSWYYVYTLKNTLTNMVYLGEETSADPNVLIYKFKDAVTSSGAYVLWAKTKKNYTVKNYKLKLKGAPKNATKIELEPGEINGKSSALAITNGQVSVDISERPVFVKVDHIR